MNKWGVYIIQSLLYPERVYVGSTINLRKRKNNHLRLLRKGIHHSPKLQNHYNKYGEDDIVFEVIESESYCCIKHLLAREQGWYEHFCFNKFKLPFFNTSKIAGAVMQNRHHTEGAKKKISMSLVGNKYNLGNKHSEDTKQKMSEKRKGKPHSMEWRKNQSIAATGKHQTPESIRKMAESKKGKPVSQETRKKLSVALKGKKKSKESIQKRIDFYKRLRDEKQA